MRFRDICISVVALGSIALPALADGPVAVVGQAEPGLIVPMHRQAPAHELIQISNMHREVVGLMMQQDVVAPEVIQLQMGNQPIFVDPDRSYVKQMGGIDSGHSILRAQRTYKSLTAHKTAYVIRRGELAPVMQREPIVPRAILIRPDYLERRTPQSPQAPAPAPLKPKFEKGPVASAM